METYENPIIVNEWLNYLNIDLGRSKQTIRAYSNDMNLFFNKLIKNKPLDIKISDITLDIVKIITYEDIRNVLNNWNASASSRNRRINCLKSLYNYICNNRELIDVNPTVKLKIKKVEQKTVKYLTLEESKNLLSIIKGTHQKRDYAIITLFLNCGLRLSELTNLKINDINENKLLVHGKGNKERVIPLNVSCQKALQEYLNLRKNENEEILFLSQKGGKISNIRIEEMVKEYLKKIGKPAYSVHKLRHTAATLMHGSGTDIRIVQKFLGHESIITTQRYTHVSDKQLEIATNNLNI